MPKKVPALFPSLDIEPRAEILANRERVLQGYEDRRNAATIAGQERIHASDRQSAERVGLMQKQAHLEGIQLQLNAKGENTVVLPKGSQLIDKQGNVLATNDAEDKAPKPITVPEGASVVDQDGNELYKNPKDANEQVTKEVSQFQSMVNGRFGIGFREKLNPAERGQYDALISRGTDLIYNNAKAGNAFGTLVDEFNRLGARAGGSGELSPAVKSARERFKWGTP